VALAALTRVTRAIGPLRSPVAAVVGARWYARLTPAERVRAAANHHRLQPRLGYKDAAALARHSYQEYVRMIADSMWAEPLTSAETLALFQVQGAEHLDVGDRAAMVVLPHFGNWDIAASASLGLGLHLSTVMAPVVSPGITEMVALSRQRKGLEIFTVRQAARGLFRALRRGRTVALMLDVPEAGPTVVVPFCGGPVRCSAVPARLAAATGAAILPVTCRREGRGWALEIHPAVSLEGGDAAVMARVAAQVEPAIRARPEQWYPFHHVYADDTGADALAPEAVRD
jgi:phosphatidylinositol dimannoside acyltransferase